MLNLWYLLFFKENSFSRIYLAHFFEKASNVHMFNMIKFLQIMLPPLKKKTIIYYGWALLSLCLSSFVTRKLAIVPLTF